MTFTRVSGDNFSFRIFEGKQLCNETNDDGAQDEHKVNAFDFQRLTAESV